MKSKSKLFVIRLLQKAFVDCLMRVVAPLLTLAQPGPTFYFVQTKCLSVRLLYLQNLQSDDIVDSLIYALSAPPRCQVRLFYSLTYIPLMNSANWVEIKKSGVVHCTHQWIQVEFSI